MYEMVVVGRSITTTWLYAIRGMHAHARAHTHTHTHTHTRTHAQMHTRTHAQGPLYILLKITGRIVWSER